MLVLNNLSCPELYRETALLPFELPKKPETVGSVMKRLSEVGKVEIRLSPACAPNVLDVTIPPEWWISSSRPEFGSTVSDIAAYLGLAPLFEEARITLAPCEEALQNWDRLHKDK